MTAGTPYYYVVSGVNSNGEGYNSGETGTSAGLPTPWASQDVGTVVLPGTSSRTPTGFQLTASGTQIGGTSDSFQFAYIPVTGDTTIIAHVAGMMNVSGQDRAGVMMRESLDPGSKFAAILIEDDGNLRLTKRTTTNGTASTSGSVNDSFWAPGWIKLERIGNTFNAYLSTDGVNWGSPFTSQTFTMNSTLYVGLATTSRTNMQTIVANFDNVQILPGVTVNSASFPIDQRPDTLVFTFSTDVSATLSASDLVLTRANGGPVPAVQSVQWNASTKTATFFLTPGDPANGAYTATLPAYSVNATAGEPLNADFSFQYNFVLGDATKNGIVDSADFNILASHFNMTGQTWSTGDFNYDGVVNASDFDLLASNYGKTFTEASVAPQVLSLTTSSTNIAPPPQANSQLNLFSSQSITPDKYLEELLAA